jgi:molecular chaperone DnaJ
MDPYKVLGIDPGTSEEEIKKVYKKLALEWHPDRHGGDSKAEEKFKEINTAYQILTGKIKQPNQGFPPGFNPEATDEELFEFFRGGVGFSFGDMFPPFMHRTQAQMRLSIQLSLEEVCAGGRKAVRFVKQSKCHSCSGIGREISKEVCPACGGAGKSTASTSSVFTVFMTCQACSGLGKKFGGLCGTCRGARMVATQHETTVEIPPGIGNGETVAAADGSHVTVHYMEHPVFNF